MTDDHLPTGPTDDRDRLPARQDPNVARALANYRGGGAFSLDLLDDRREADPDEIDLLAYWHVLVKRRRLIAGVLAAVVAVALLLTLMTQPMYRASALMQIDKEPAPIVQTTGAGYYDGWDPEFLSTQYELLKSRALAERVANELRLSAETLAALNDPGWLARVMGLLRPADKKSSNAQADQATTKAEAELLDQSTGLVQGGLTVQPVRNSRLVRLNFDSPDAKLSVRVVNAVTEGFIASSLERRMGTTSYAKTYLEDQLAQAKAKLEEAERKVVEFAQAEGLVNTGAEGASLATQNLTELNGLLAAAQSDRIRAQARWRQASSGALSADMLTSSSIGTLQQQRAALQGQYQQKLAVFKPDYPEMVQLKAQVDAINREIGTEMGRVRASVKAEYDAASSNEGMLKGQIANLRGEALDTDSRSIQYNILKRDADTNRQMYDSLLQRYKEVGAAGDVRSNNISIIDRAQGGYRFKPNLFKNLALGLLAGLLLGILLAFVLEFLDDTLKTPEDLEQKLKLAVLGVIPKLGQKQNVAEVSADPRSSFSEAYRSVRTALQFATDHGVPRSLLVTSPSPSEGKSTTALALARNFAQLGKKVLLIEADLRNPSLHRMLGIKGEVGLSNLLSGSSRLTEVTLATDEERLSVILAGPLPPNPAELLSGSKFVSMLTVACERYDQIIIDGPPVLGLADSPILANAVEGTLLVITSGKTRIAFAQQALKRLLVARGRIVGALLAKYDAKAAGYGRGYHYNYDDYYAYGGKPRLTRS